MLLDWNFHSRMNKGKSVIPLICFFNLLLKQSLFYKPLPVSSKLFLLFPCQQEVHYPLKFTSLGLSYSGGPHWCCHGYCLLVTSILIGSIHWPVITYFELDPCPGYQSNHHLWKAFASLPLCCHHHLNSSHLIIKIQQSVVTS